MRRALLAAGFLTALILPFGLSSDTRQGAAVYNKECLKCHGPEGKGDGPAARLLKKQSMGDLSSQEALSKYSDQELFKFIAEGGEAVGKSKLMVPYRKKLSEAEMKAVIEYIKKLAQQK